MNNLCAWPAWTSQYCCLGSHAKSLHVFPPKKTTVAVVLPACRYRLSEVPKDWHFLILFSERGCMLKIWLLAETAKKTCFDSADILWGSAQILKLPFAGGLSSRSAANAASARCVLGCAFLHCKICEMIHRLWEQNFFPVNRNHLDSIIFLLSWGLKRPHQKQTRTKTCHLAEFFR